MNSPTTKAWLSLIVSFALIALALFITAGTIHFWQAWVYLAAGAASSIPLTQYLVNDPILLENRTKAGPIAEQRPVQKIIVAVIGLTGIATFVLPGFDHRFGWSSVPPWLAITGDLLILLSMWMVYRVFKANSFGSATVKISEHQRVVSDGPYAIVRNPMYSSAVVYFIGTSLALGSYWGLIPAALTVLGFVARLYDEEAFLNQNLSGYRDYCAKVRWHLIPGLF